MLLRRRILALLIAYGIASFAAGVVLSETTLHPGHSPGDTESYARGLAEHDGLREEPARILAADGAELRASWVLPREPKGKTVLLLHGVSGDRAGQLGFALFLAEHGYSALAIDSRAHGQSGGLMATYGLLEREDIHRWATYAARRSESTEIYGFGASMGAAIMLQSLPATPEFRGIIAECPFATFHSEAYDRLTGFSGLPSPVSYALFAGPIESALLYVHARHGIVLEDANVEQAVSSAHVPILLIHGDQDRTIPISHSERLVRSNPQYVSLWRVPGAGHVHGWAANPPEYQRRVLELLTRQ